MWTCENCGHTHDDDITACRNCGKLKINDEKLSPSLVDAVLTSVEPLQPEALEVDSHELLGSPRSVAGVRYPHETNTIGVIGFWFSLIGAIFAYLPSTNVFGLFSFLLPIGLIVSVIGLWKKPRGFAIAGTIIGALWFALPILIFVIKFGWPRINAFFERGMEPLP